MFLDHFRSRSPLLAVIFTMNGFMHLVLDSISGEIYWSARLGRVGDSFGIGKFLPWNDGFLELCIVLWALYLWKMTPVNELLASLDNKMWNKV